jgi:hypothetical protein
LTIDAPDRVDEKKEIKTPYILLCTIVFHLCVRGGERKERRKKKTFQSPYLGKHRPKGGCETPAPTQKKEISMRQKTQNKHKTLTAAEPKPRCRTLAVELLQPSRGGGGRGEGVKFLFTFTPPKSIPANSYQRSVRAPTTTPLLW